MSALETSGTNPEQAKQIKDDVEQKSGGVWDAFYGFIFPKIAPIPWSTFLFLAFLIAIP